jgi:hypothetical protein
MRALLALADRLRLDVAGAGDRPPDRIEDARLAASNTSPSSSVVLRPMLISGACVLIIQPRRDT